MTRVELVGPTYPWAKIVWDDDRIARIEAAGAAIDCTLIRDPLLGDAHAVITGDRVLTRISAIDWARPTEIPAIAAPGALPPGAGAAIMNLLAILAQRAGVPALRYAGPYPTSALFKTLARSFRTMATEAELTADLLDRMTRLARDPIPIDFVPAPHERIPLEAGHLELRDGRLERTMIDRITYERAGSPARLVDHDPDVAAELWFGDACYARIATFTADGTRLDGLHPIPACTSDVIGKPFPPPLVGALAELVAEAVPSLLADDARTWLATRPIAWADLKARAARLRDGTIEVHAAIWQHVAPHGMARLALALAEAIAPIATTALVAELASRAR